MKRTELVWLTVVIFGLIINCCDAVPTPRRICVESVTAGSNSDPVDDGSSDEDNTDGDDNYNEYEIPQDVIVLNNTLNSGETMCGRKVNFCYALWNVDINGTVSIVRQGCWDSSDKLASCHQSECISKTQSTDKYKFCCCTGDLCNSEVTSVEPFEKDGSHYWTSQIPPTAGEKSIFENPITWVCFLAGVCILISMGLIIACRVSPKTESELAPLAPSGPGYSSNLHNVDNLKLCGMIDQGKYGTVWKGIVNEQPVAVKIFPSHHKQYFLNEKDIYTLSLMENPALLSYFGCDERRTMDDNIEYLLVLSLAPLGCLQDWLIENTASYSVFCKMAKSIAHGLSHLHSEMRKGDIYKPCVCHRDLNTRNILIKNDLSCCICDFGFALKTFGSRYEYKGEITLAETKSINEVGTLRYMAPEILEGAVNLRDCESALKQIDVYSLGLILWELCTRCHDLYPAGQTAPAYRAPYEAEVGKNPTYEQMQVFVSRHKARPLFPPGWGGGSAAKIAKETCEDCWDHDAEARLTALCVEERLHELSLLRPRSYPSRGPSPPLSTNNFISQSPNITNNMSPVCTTTNSFPPSETSIITPPNQIIPHINNNHSFNNYFTEGTAETIVSLNSPSGPSDIPIKNRAIFSQQIQSFQGRNPCLERNLAPVIPNAQVLVNKSKKHSFLNKEEEVNSFSRLEDDVNVEDLISSQIPKGSNFEGENNMGEGFPKQNNTDKKLKGWYGVRAMIQKKLFKRNIMFGQESDEKSNLVSKKLTIRVNIDDNVTHLPFKVGKTVIVNQHNQKNQPTKQNDNERRQREITTRPSNLDLIATHIGRGNYCETSSSSGFERINGFLENDLSQHPHIIRNINFGHQINRRPPGDHSEQSFTVIEASTCDYSTSDNVKHYPPRIVISKSANAVKSLNIDGAILSEKQIKRQRSLEVFREVFGSKGSNDRLRDPSQRVKTPGDVPPSVRKVRASKTLSLYDDRMMDSSIGNTL